MVWIKSNVDPHQLASSEADLDIHPLQEDIKYSKTCINRPLKKKTEIDFQDRLSLNAGQKYCRMLQGEHSVILSTFIKLQFVIKIFVLSI